ncbi:hypothetical protein AB6H17_02650 [Proteus vulgaris]|uniref:hypothetical protein n=1 Tax=Proteus vulgaris TaxID=585 RepID=UPI0034DCC881
MEEIKQSLEAESNKLSEKAAELKQDASKTADNLMQEADNKVDRLKSDASKTSGDIKQQAQETENQALDKARSINQSSKTKN